MPSVATREVLALDAPVPPRPMSVLDVVTFWHQKLVRERFEVVVLPVIPHESSSHPERIEENTDQSREMLSAAGGLVIADSETSILQLDSSVLAHITQAAELGVPVFLQAPFEEIAPKGASRPDAEMIYMGGQPNVIRERLGG